MAVTITTDTQVGPTDWLWEWSSDLGGTPTYYLYVDGVLVATTTRPWYQVSLTPGEQVQFEVLDTDDLPTPAYPSRVWLMWDAVTDAATYRIDRWDGDSWEPVQTVTPAFGQTYFRVATAVLEDGVTHRYRVVPIAGDGNEGTAREYVIPVVRRPDPPDVAYTYDADTGEIVVSEAE